MTARVTFIATALAAVASYLCFHMGIVDVAGGLIANRSIVDFGIVNQGTVVSADVELSNKYGGRFRIESLRVTCSCAVASLSSRDINHGDISILTLKWNSGSYRGKVSTQVNVSYADVDSGEVFNIPISILAEVAPDYSYSCERLVFQPPRVMKQTVVFSANRVSEVSLLSAYCTNRAFKASIGGEDRQVEVVFDPSEWNDADDVTPFLIVETSSANEKSCKIPLLVSRTRVEP